MVDNAIFAKPIIKTYLEVGTSAEASGNYEIAEKMYKAALLETTREEHQSAAAQLLYQVASTLLNQGRAARAERLFKRGLVQLNAQLGVENPLRVIYLLRIIEAFIPQGKFRVATNTYKKARSLLLSNKGIPLNELEAVLLRIAKAWHAQSKTHEAMEVYKDIIAIRRRQLSEKTSCALLRELQNANMLLSIAIKKF